MAAGAPPNGLLSAPEISVYANLFSEKRRQDWLLGRWTAKKLIQSTIENSGERPPASHEISILAAEDGAPEVWIGKLDALKQAAFTLSISHSHDAALCATTGRGSYQLGADIELIESRSDLFAADYFSATEQQAVNQVPSDHQACLVTAIWSGKEAALKAVRQGLRLDTRSVCCIFETPFEIAYEWQPFSIQWREAGRAQQQGWWRAWGNFVLTLVVERRLSLHDP